MNTTPAFKQWRHHTHEEGEKFTHFSGHLLHEKTFWAIVGLVALIAALFTLLVLWGSGAIPELQSPQYIW